jgi:hypothetical protein
VKPSPISTLPEKSTNLTADPQELIRIRAYELFEQRGCEHGHDTDDWIQAEKEITTVRINRAAA